MKVWLDAHLAPGLAAWLRSAHGLEAHALRDLGLRDADDTEIFFRCKAEGAVFFTKDRDFAQLVAKHGSPPQVVWIRTGNCPNEVMKQVLDRAMPVLQTLIKNGDPLIEVL